MSAADIAARVQRLTQLARGIAHEIQLVEKADSFLYRERRDYFDALRRLWTGVENARVVLAEARRRMRE
jgi:hypothetical protein